MKVDATIRSAGRGARLAPGGYSPYLPSTALVLLYAAAAMTTFLSWIAALRSTEALTERAAAYVAGGAAVAFFGVAGLRVYLRELLQTLEPRERALLFLVHLVCFCTPLFLPGAQYFIYCLLALQAPIVLFLVERRHFERLFALQLAVMVLAGLTDPVDDGAGVALQAGFAGLLIAASFLLRASSAAERYSCRAPISLGRLGRAILPPLLAVALLAVAGATLLKGRDFDARPTLRLPIGERAQRATASGAGFGEQVTGLLIRGALLAGALLLAAWALDRLRALFSRSKGKEIAAAFVAAAVESAAGAPEEDVPPADVSTRRRRIVTAYASFLHRIGKRAGPRRPGQTAGEYGGAVLARNEFHGLEPDYDGATASFEVARYGGEADEVPDPESFEQSLRVLESDITQRLPRPGR